MKITVRTTEDRVYQIFQVTRYLIELNCYVVSNSDQTYRFPLGNVYSIKEEQE